MLTVLLLSATIRSRKFENHKSAKFARVPIFCTFRNFRFALGKLNSACWVKWTCSSSMHWGPPMRTVLLLSATIRSRKFENRKPAKVARVPNFQIFHFSQFSFRAWETLFRVLGAGTMLPGRGCRPTEAHVAGRFRHG